MISSHFNFLCDLSTYFKTAKVYKVKKIYFAMKSEKNSKSLILTLHYLPLFININEEQESYLIPRIIKSTSSEYPLS